MAYLGATPQPSHSPFVAASKEDLSVLVNFLLFVFDHLIASDVDRVSDDGHIVVFDPL